MSPADSRPSGSPPELFPLAPHEPDLPELADTLLALQEAAIQIRSELRFAALRGKLGFAGGRNSSGDRQRTLDLVANQILVDALTPAKTVDRVISEEMREPLRITARGDARRKLVVAIDPLDGSTNLDVNGAVGTIFGIYRARDEGRDEPGHRLPGGPDLLAAGYVLYGPATLLILSTGKRVRGFTLDESQSRFLLSHPDITCPKMGAYLCTNFAHHPEWPDACQRYAESLMIRPADGSPTYSLRYSGSLAMDAHRILLQGGIYFYPPDRSHPHGKIRLLYEALPLAFLFERASGRSTDGHCSLLLRNAQSTHEQVHVAFGSSQPVACYSELLSEQNAQAMAEERWRRETFLGGDKESA